MKATLSRTTNQNIRINSLSGQGGPIQSTALTLKNQVSEINSIEDIRDVEEVSVTDGATLIYNSQNDKYEIRQLDIGDLPTDNLQLDGGEF
jgi:hypothetical protein